MSDRAEAYGVLGELWRRAGEDLAALNRAQLTGGDPVLPSDFKLATVAAASPAAAMLAAAELWRLRSGRRQHVAVDARAAAAAFRSERYLRVAWRERRGFDSLVQSVSGIAHEGGVAAGTDGPRHLPAQALDHATGYLAAFGAMVALARRAREGGSYLVRVSLAQTGRWLDRLGRVAGHGVPDPRVEDVEAFLQTTATPFGVLRHVSPAAILSETPASWARPSVPLGTHAPEWWT